MSYNSMYVHKETFKIKGGFYTVIADFNKDKLWIENDGHKIEYSMDDYTNKTGNMVSFVKSKIIGNI